MNNLSSSSGASRCGFIALVGRPNVGKSTLLNHLLGKKVSITSRKPQTTRQRILGIKNSPGAQAIYVDTPGFHHREGVLLNQFMNRQVAKALGEVDLIVFIITATDWTSTDAELYEKIKQTNLPILLAINKIDEMPDKNQLLPQIKRLSEQLVVQAIIPLSALKKQNIAALENNITGLLPERKFLFAEDQVTTCSESFLAAELIREKITRSLGEELPYVTTVFIDSFKKEHKVWHIQGIIIVEKIGQKGIIIGKKGERLKQIGQQARCDMERLFNHKVYLTLWVKVKKLWTQQPNLLNQFGYTQDQE